MSSSRLARSRRPDCSPSTQRSASAMLDLPDPFGPTMAVMPWPNSNRVREAKLLKPCRSSRFRYTVLLARRRQRLQCLPGGVQFRLLLVAPLSAAEHLLAHGDFHREQLGVVRAFRGDEFRS